MSTLVSVIIPAFNAAATIDETLHSVRAQSFRDLDIVVVDDGSTDDTATHVLRHRQDDPRVRLVRQSNGGVARARNLGIDQALGELIAPVDADDLWHPRKIERQMQALQLGGDRVGLVYCWYAVIDEESRIIDHGGEDRDEGDVIGRMCTGNLVGNGSAALMRKQAVIDAGGYDPDLRDQNAQGCEDWKLYFRIAERHHFAVVPAYLVGYRWSDRNMSSDSAKMLRSYDMVMQPLLAKYPEHEERFQIGRAYILKWLFRRAIRCHDFTSARVLYRDLVRRAPHLAREELKEAPAVLAGKWWQSRKALRFLDPLAVS
jgi:glycosyltransferase involved in cell wall biosynthesis